MSALLAQIKDGMKDAMRAKEKERLTAIRMLLAQIKQVEVDSKIEVQDADIIAILDKMIKQRRDSITQFEAADRQELADAEKLEIEALQVFLPKALDDNEIAQLIDAAVTESGAESMKDMGKVMGILKPQMQGRADMGKVSGLIKARLS
ncbi:GatB/YqeY domain-containing protein [Aliikangiella maris]|uniref:GatB/YqeY domain-containing protein n=2 Tax=Aliikangiella maris TaxID=3162458 RepID=A0ABV2BRJ3_9GAMM